MLTGRSPVDNNYLANIDAQTASRGTPCRNITAKEAATNSVIASEAKQSILAEETGLLRRFSAKLLCNFVASSLAQTLHVGRRQ